VGSVHSMADIGLDKRTSNKLESSELSSSCSNDDNGEIEDESGYSDDR